MSFTVQMPALGESVTEGTVTRWLKQEGDQVEIDEPLLEVSTDKVDTEIPSPAAGVLQRIVAAEDETVEVGGDLAVIGDGSDTGGSDDGDDQPAAEQPAEEPEPEQPAAEKAAPEESAPEPAGRHAAPAPGGSGDSGGSGGSGGDSSPVVMPALGESVTEGTVTRWLKQVGDEVAVDEPLLEVSTDKVDTEIPSPVAGTLLEITAAEDETVEVGGQLALIGSGAPAEESSSDEQPSSDEKAEEPPAEQAAKPEADSPWREPGSDDAAEHKTETSEPETSEPEAKPEPVAEADDAEDTGDGTPNADSNGSGGAPYVTPLVRKLAVEHGVDLTSVRGTGVGGRIRKQDVLAAAKPEPEPEPEKAQPAAASAPAAATRVPGAAAPASSEPSPDEAATLRGTTQKLSRLRKVIAQRMVESLQVSAQLTCVVEVDVTKVALLRQRAKSAFEAREGVKLSFLPFFVKATVDTLKLYPNVNASIDTEKAEVTYHNAEHIGIAVDTDRGLLVPVLHNAGDLNIAGISRQIADLADRTRTNKIKPDELSGGTFTITNIGSRGALTDTPIINQPQVAILGTGAVVKRPVVVTDELGQDTIAIRSIASLVLTYDHRLVDGADAARFLTSVKARIEEAAFESDLGI
jgi:2-oxoglutarate dehydrogenase E2 component (dihydrolipoamide succinyltransferase)